MIDDKDNSISEISTENPLIGTDDGTREDEEDNDNEVDDEDEMEDNIENDDSDGNNFLNEVHILDRKHVDKASSFFAHPEILAGMVNITFKNYEIF